MARKKGGFVRGGVGARSSTTSTIGSSKRITIKPFSKPPTLPAKFYETTSEQLLQGTLQILKQQQRLQQQQQQHLSVAEQQQQQTNQNNSNNNGINQHGGSGSNSSTTKLSLQNSYTAVVNLVSHQFGPRLYADLRLAMQQAAKLVLPDTANATTAGAATSNGSSSSNSSSSVMMDTSASDPMIVTGGTAAATTSMGGAAATGSRGDDGTAVLSHIQKQYELYVEYLLLCKHVFLPLDRSHLWQETAATTNHTNHNTPGGGGGIAIKRTMATPAGTNSMTLWEVGLHQFRNRLIELSLDRRVYRHWFEMLMNDWDGKFALRQLLQSTWYMWQDLHMLPNLLTDLQNDLQVFLTNCSQRYKGTEPYPASQFLTFVYDKWMHMSYQWTFLPKTWLCTLLEVHLLQPHLHPDWLLLPKHFYPMLEQELLHQQGFSSSAATTTASMMLPPQSPASPSKTSTVHYYSNASPIVKFWMLAGRLPNGYKQVAACIASYARAKGLALIQNNAPATSTTTAAPPSTPRKAATTTAAAASSTMTANNNNSTNMIADLLDLQRQLYRLVCYKLPKGSDHIILKSVWEEVVNTTSTTTPSVAEALAKFVDQILKSTKKMDQYALQQQMQISQQQQHQQQQGAGLPGTTTTTTTSTTNASNDLLSRIISGIFVHLQAKDIFEAFYKRDLAKRLLWNRVVSMDVEKHFCSLLKAECGAGYTSKMEGMFQDIDWSREAMSRYKQTLYNNNDNNTNNSNNSSNVPVIEMEAQVLTTGYWPVYTQYPNLILLESLKIPQERFTNHYKTKYQGRRMTWQYALGHCLVRANGFKLTTKSKKGHHKVLHNNNTSANNNRKVYELIVSLCQALVLIQFENDRAEFTLPQLMSKIGLEDRDEMERILQSLSLGKDGTRVLRKIDHDAEMTTTTSSPSSVVPTATGNSPSPTKKLHRKVRINVHDKDRFIINNNFESNQRRIRVTNIMLKETKEERDKTVETVSRDRLYMIDASLVRIMKARKTILHQQLIPQVLEQVKVPVSSGDIKKRIESLIEREYMERDSKDRSRYNYLA